MENKFDLLDCSIQDSCSFFKTNLKIFGFVVFCLFFFKFTLLNYIWVKTIVFSPLLIP